MIEAGLVLARFDHFACLAILFGAAWSPAYADTVSIEPPLRRVRRAAAALAIVSALAWFELAVAGMADAPAAALDPATLWMTTSGTDFGRVWAVRTGGLAALWGLIAFKRQAARGVELGLAGLLLAGLALTGHAQAETGRLRWLHASADALHLLAAGLWLGGLVVLGIMIVAGRKGDESARNALRRFSGTGLAAVAALVGTGLVNAWFLVRSPAALLTTTYGQILLAKLILFAAMVALAALNRRDAWGDAAPLAGLRRRVLSEQILGAGVLACVAALGTIAPAAGLGA